MRTRSYRFSERPVIRGLALFALALSLLFPHWVEARTVAVSGAARVTYAKGIVNVRRSQLVSPGYRLKTGRTGRIALAFSNGHRLRIGPNSNVLLVSYNPRRKQTLVRVKRGRVWNRVKRGNRVVVRSRHSTAAVLGTAYDIEVKDQETLTTVLQGSVGVQPTDSKAPDPTPEDIFKGIPAQVPTQSKPSNGGFQAPVEVGSSVTEIAAPMKAVPGPQEVSMDQWLEIVENQQISMNSAGQAMVRNIDAHTLNQQVEWVRWNQQMDKEFKGE